MSFRTKFSQLLILLAAVALNALLILASGLPRARAEVVLDQSKPETVVIESKQEAPAKTVDVTSAPTQSVGVSSQPTQTVEVSNQIEVKKNIVVPTAPSAVIADESVGYDHPISSKPVKSDLLRRERMREEIRNEDLLQERLEELRLRDEQKRSHEILTNKTEKTEPAAGPAPVVVAPTPQVVVVPATDRKIEKKDEIVISQSSVEKVEGKNEANLRSASPSVFGINFDGGVSSMTGVSGVDVKAQYSVGGGLSFGVDEHFSIDLGYHYSRYGIRLISPTSFAWAVGSQSPSTVYDQRGETNTVKQNVFDVGVRLFPLDARYTVRPFIGIGGGYAKSYINYNEKILSLLKSQGYPSTYTSDYELAQWLGYLSAGLDVQITRNITFGAIFKYYKALASSENQPLNNAALYYNGYSGGYSPVPVYNPAQVDKSMISGSIANSSFYSVLAGITFQF